MFLREDAAQLRDQGVDDAPAVSLRAAESAIPVRMKSLAIGAQMIGGLALGAIAVGAIAVGTLAIGRLVMGAARIRKLEIDELTVHELHVTDMLETPKTPWYEG